VVAVAFASSAVVGFAAVAASPVRARAVAIAPGVAAAFVVRGYVARPVRARAVAIAPGVAAAFVVHGHVARPVRDPAAAIAFVPVSAVAPVVRVAEFAPEVGAVAARAAAVGLQLAAAVALRRYRLAAVRARPAARRAAVLALARCVPVRWLAGSPGRAAVFRVHPDARNARWAIRPAAVRLAGC